MAYIISIIIDIGGKLIVGRATKQLHQGMGGVGYGIYCKILPIIKK